MTTFTMARSEQPMSRPRTLVEQVRTIASRGRMDDADVQILFDAADVLAAYDTTGFPPPSGHSHDHPFNRLSAARVHSTVGDKDGGGVPAHMYTLRWRVYTWDLGPECSWTQRYSYFGPGQPPFPKTRVPL